MLEGTGAMHTGRFHDLRYKGALGLNAEQVFASLSGFPFSSAQWNHAKHAEGQWVGHMLQVEAYTSFRQQWKYSYHLPRVHDFLNSAFYIWLQLRIGLVLD